MVGIEGTLRDFENLEDKNWRRLFIDVRKKRIIQALAMRMFKSMIACLSSARM